MSILNTVLGEFKEGDKSNSISVKINKGGSSEVTSSVSESPVVIYPDSAIDENVILSCGGTIVKIPFQKIYLSLCQKIL